jgi:hypothetical protein
MELVGYHLTRLAHGLKLFGLRPVEC